MGISYNAWLTPNYIFRDEGGVFSGNLAGQAAFDYFRDNCQAGDALYFGHNPRFDDLRLYVGTAFAAQSATFAWEYWDGSAWVPLAVTDGTQGFTHLGEGTVAFVPPDDWRAVQVNGLIQMWVRCRLAAVTDPTEGGANSTQAAQAGDNLFQVTGFPEAAPADFEALHAAAPEIVRRQGDRQYFLGGRLQIGGGAAAWFIDSHKQVEMAYWGVPWSGILSLWTEANGHLRWGQVLDAPHKIGGQGITLDGGPCANHKIRNFGGSMEFYGCSFQAPVYDLEFNSSGGMKFWNCLINSSNVKLWNLWEGEVCHCQFLGAALGEPQPTLAIEDCVLHVAAGPVIETYTGGQVLRGLKIHGSPSVLVWVYHDGSPITFIDCDSVTWRISWNNCRQPVYRKYTLALRVSDPEDNPLGGAEVSIRDKEGRPVAGSPFTTGEDGRIPAQELVFCTYTYEAGQPEDTRTTYYSPYTITVAREGYGVYTDVVEVDRPRDLEIALGPPRYVRGPIESLDMAMEVPHLELKAVAQDVQIEFD
jgi:hypothetical protein|uniref:Carboxypeptidase regulatory-like domain-containing protein n=1 Tax=Desulfobacca acetoxidans TaxID=60893 RepID=A0A7C3WGW3_9BACT